MTLSFFRCLFFTLFDYKRFLIAWDNGNFIRRDRLLVCVFSFQDFPLYIHMYIHVFFSKFKGASARYSSRTRSSMSSPSSPSSKSVGTRESPKASRSRKLPFGWESAIDASSGREYFFHRASNRSQWDFPHDSS